ncbi:MAG: lipid-binding SYLF domain-containing protein [Acidobacteria bacterium]|nr:lipid-binding SYLF domain-containing protein [Acidobacteriota bacterium]
MKKTLAALTLSAFAAAVSLPALAQNGADAELTQASQIIQQMTGPQQPSGIPTDVLTNAKCIAVIPKLLKAGFGFGAEHGNGVVTCKLANGHWSPPAPFSMTGGSFGLQIGGEEVAYIMLAMTDQGMQAIMSGHFKVGAGVNAAAGPVGRDASASAGWKGASLLSYSRSKGAYAGATLNGTELNQDHAKTKELYGKELPFNSILDGGVHMPDQSAATQFVHTVNQAVENAH